MTAGSVGASSRETMVCTREDEARGDHDGIDGGLRHRAMTALAVESDVDGVGVRERVAGDEPDLSGRNAAVVVNGKSIVGLGEAREEAILEHGGSAGADLFGRLSDEHESAMPAVASVAHERGGADQAGHVNVVPAGVHDGNVVAGGVFGDDVARVGQAGVFVHRKSVEFGAQHDHWAVAVLQDADNAGATDSGGDFESELTEGVGKFGGGVHFVQREFGIAMKIEIQGFDAWVDSVDVSLGEVLSRGGKGQEKNGNEWAHAGTV